MCVNGYKRMYTLELAAGIVVLFFIISKAADFLVGGLVDVGKRFRLSDFTVGFLILGIATSSPELFIGIQSVSTQVPELAFGNLVGASFVLVTLVAGIAALRNKGFSLDGQLSRRAFSISSLLILSPLALALDGYLSRIDGLLLVALYAVYVGTVFFHRRTLPFEEIFHARKPSRTVFNIVAGLALLLISSRVIVLLGELLAEIAHIPLVVTGIVLFGLGTNLPEIMLAFRAKKFGHSSLSFGNIVGSAASNSLIVGVVCILSPFTFTVPALLVSSGSFLVLGLALFTIFTLSKNTLNMNEGLGLIAIYASFIIAEYALLPSFS